MLQMTELAGQGGTVLADSRKEIKFVGTDSCRPIKMAHEASDDCSKNGVGHIMPDNDRLGQGRPVT